MSACTGAPAAQYALAYIEGKLPEFEVERFERHYFDCPACFARVQALEAVEHLLAEAPPVEVAKLRRGPVQVSSQVWILAVAAALVLAVMIGLRLANPHPGGPTQAQNTPIAPGQQTAPSPKPAQTTPAELADLTLPPFVGANLRGIGADAHFEAGMTAYQRGDCAAAIPSLAQVPAANKDAEAAVFYSAACQMRLGEISAAAAGLKKVAADRESLHQELAIYSLAQLALARSDPQQAHQYLLHTIALHGDLEQKARTQDQKVLALSAVSGEPGSSGRGGK